MRKKTKSKFFDFLRRRQERIARNKLKRKKRISKLSSKKIGKAIIQSERKRNFNSTKSIPTPKKFSFLANTESMIRYLNANAKNIKAGHNAFFDLSDIESLSFDAIALLLAKIKHKDFLLDRKAYGNSPTNPDLNRLFATSSFLKFVNTSFRPWIVSSWEMFHHAYYRKLNTDIAARVTDVASDRIFPSGELYYQPLYALFIECMMNTTEHAWAGKKSTYDWWIFYHLDEKKNLMHVCFLDFGVWILGSLKDWRGKLLAPFASNGERLRKIFHEEIELPSRTWLPERWRGLPSIYKYSKRPEVRNLTVITNDVVARLSEDIYIDIREKFYGTFISWEIHFNAE